MIGAAAGLLALATVETRASSVGASPANSRRSTSTGSSQAHKAISNSTATPNKYPTGPETVVGPLVNFGYGEISVQVAIANGRIARVSVRSFKTLDSYSTQLGQIAIPILEKEVLTAQGLPIRVVSGATYTSEGYASSVYSILKKLKG